MSSSFINLLYDPLKALPTEEAVYTDLLSDNDFMSVSPQVYQLLKQHEKLFQTPAFFQNELKDKFNKTFYQNLFIKNQTEKLLKKFEELQIQVIPLKGVFFSEKYFSHLGARATTDIDLLIHYPDFEKAKETVKSLGFIREEEMIPNHFHCSFSKNIPGSPVPLVVELHWNLLKENTANFDIDDIWKQANSFNDSQYIKELCGYHTFYFICLHSWRHNLNSMKHYLDIVHLVHSLRQEVDYAKLINDAASQKTSKRVIRTLSLVYREFPHLSELKKFEFKRNMIIKSVDLKGFRKYVDIIDYQFFNYDSFKHGFRELRLWVKNEGIVAFHKKMKYLVSWIKTTIHI